MAILNFGSCSIDHVYSLPHFARPGETLSCSTYEIHPGGKGLNQSIALANAGAAVHHAGKVGEDGDWLKELLNDKGVEVSSLAVSDGPTGHAIIQVTPGGENSIVLFGGANQEISPDDIDRTLGTTAAGDFILIQNEISSLDYLINRAIQQKLRVIFNAAPMTDAVRELPLAEMELLIINETEGYSMTGEEDPMAAIGMLTERYGPLKVLMTIGVDGAYFSDGKMTLHEPARQVEPLDTTGAGDTFVGFFLAGYSEGKRIQDCLRIATHAAAICITRRGAASSIPTIFEVAD